MNYLLQENTIGFVKSLLSGDEKNIKKAPYLKGSISNYTKNLIMTFPVLCDNSLQPSTASMISKAHERNLVTMLQLLFASEQFNGSSGVDVLSSVHRNINANMSMDDYIDALDAISVKCFDKAGIAVENAQINQAIREMTEELKHPKYTRFPVNSFSEKSINDFVALNMNGNTVVQEVAPRSPYQDTLDQQKMQINQQQIDNFANKKKYDEDMNRNSNAEEIRNSELFPAKKHNIQAQNTDFESNYFTKQLLDSDVKKANELTPTLMIIRYNEMDPKTKNIYTQRSFIAGVKARLISTDSMDIVERVIAKNKTKISFLNLIRATTGEIKLVKDFLLCIGQAKIDAKNSVKKGESAKMWKVLENLSAKNNWNRILRKGNDASCITTLVLNQETVNVLKKEYDFDIEKISNARMIMEAYNLLGIIICDESIDVAKFLYNGNDSFEQLSYSSLERESNDNSYKKVINLIGKMNGR